ncbi:thiol-disulfide oxidoreductase DCC family protein [Staphylococcus lutrae]|uniref:DUF393 domain-containing protein n=1 Tax=Staphylococcus lutrae TaxID=155085 RepID=A0AAC9RMY7_9STAP|nr:DCC1-like thiol-disulfide oxidoreductase family protein [Staphylococcus lutrae]ARJ50303.1 hypothetical protein B5P37_02705 [Staphylococcus lutrae]PNZ39974.1 DUF393 domain-containing protein [Staphylococcus lutrae]
MPIVYYDDRCVYCYNYAIWLIRHGLSRRYVFVPLKSAAGDALRASHPEVLAYNSVVLQEGDQLTFQSTAIVKLIYALDRYKALAVLLWLIPRPLRNLGYQLFANNRDKMWQTDWAQATDDEQSFFL